MIIVKIRQTTKQIHDLEVIEKTYFRIDNITPKDLVVLLHPKTFEKTNKPRHYRHCVDHMTNQFRIADKLVRNLPPSYTFKIFSSPEFKKFMRTITETNPKEVPMLDEKSREIILGMAVQMFESSISTIIKSMPEEFKTSLIESITPFSNLVIGISSYSKNIGRDKMNSDLSFLNPQNLKKLPPRRGY